MAGFIHKLLFLFYLLACLGCGASRVVVEGETPDRVLFFAVDKLQQFYLVTEQEQVIKYTQLDQVPVFQYSNQLLGRPGLIDATNPFNILLFFPQFGEVRFLDRTLSEIGALDLGNSGAFSVKAVGRSSDNHLWYYDEVLTTLVKVGQDGTPLLLTDRMDRLLGHGLDVTFLLEREQRVYLTDPGRGVFVFDVFGQYLFTLPIKGVRDFQVLNGQFMYLRQGTLHRYDLQTSLENVIELPESFRAATMLRQVGDQLFVLLDGKVAVVP